MDIIKMDFREDGQYKFFFHWPDQTDVVGGTYKLIQPPEKLIFTWIWGEPYPDSGTETQVIVEFLEQGDSTEIIIAHSPFANLKMFGMHQDGWSGAINFLDTYLAKLS